MTRLKRFAAFLSLSLLTLSSCVNTPSETTEKADPALIVTAPEKYQYAYDDPFDSTGLLVQAKEEDGSLVEVPDYTLSYKDSGDVLKDGDKLSFFGDKEILVSKEGYLSTSFTVSVVSTIQYSALEVLTSPTKTAYILGKDDVFRSDGLTVQRTSRIVTDNRRKTRRDIIDTFTLSLDGKELKDGDTLTESGSKEVTVTAKGLDGKELTTSFRIIVSDGNLAPASYPDDTIQFTQSDETRTLSITNPSSTKTGTSNYVKPEDVDLSNGISFYSNHNFEEWHYTPSTGKVPLLVVPVIFKGHESYDTDEYRDLLSTCFFGKSSSLHFESLRSYYYQASYGALEFTGSIAPSYYPQDEVADLADVAADDFTLSQQEEALNGAIPYLEKLGYNLSDYDSNKDGYIDGVWFVYAHSTDSRTQMWWGYTSVINTNTPDVQNPVLNNFGWVSFDFLNDTYSGMRNTANKSADAHVIIHETGHMMGLMDYYSYGSSNYGPTGGYDMMDHNIGDHNPYSKMLLGWTKPYLVYGNSTITLKSSQWQDQVVVIPSDSRDYSQSKYKTEEGKVRFNPFDEYLVLEFYTQQNLNVQGYDIYSANPIQGNGVRIYHVDARLGEASIVSSRYGESLRITVPSDPDDVLSTTTSNLYRFISNTESGERAETSLGSYVGLANSTRADKFDEIRLLRGDKAVSDASDATSSSDSGVLFTPTRWSTFSLSSHYNSFPVYSSSLASFDSGEACSYKVTVQA